MSPEKSVIFADSRPRVSCAPPSKGRRKQLEGLYAGRVTRFAHDGRPTGIYKLPIEGVAELLATLALRRPPTGVLQRYCSPDALNTQWRRRIGRRLDWLRQHEHGDARP